VSGAQGFPPGAKVYVDGELVVSVHQYWPEGSTSLLSPHYTVVFPGVDRGEYVRVSVKRIGVRKKNAREPSSSG
jgi:hypothetical protein